MLHSHDMESVRVFAPATVANVGSAFDVLGFALESPGDTVTARMSSVPGVRVIAITGDNGQLPLEATQNTASVSSLALLRHLQTKDPVRYREIGIELSVAKGLPIGSGLGSSSASTVAAVVATNALLGEPLSRAELLPFAMEGERIACGAAHADNVAPSLLGGFVLIRSYDPLDIVPLPSPESAWATVITPSVELRTADARKVLKRTVPLGHAIAQWGNVAALVAGIFRNDVALMGRALEDKIIEPERAQLIPGFSEAKQAALDAGAAGCTISGSGPSIFALSTSQEEATLIAARMIPIFEAINLPAMSHISRINPHGARILDEE
jgi:homoserine kinase